MKGAAYFGILQEEEQVFYSGNLPKKGVDKAPNIFSGKTSRGEDVVQTDEQASSGSQDPPLT